jgi:hypothetical protein
MHWPPPKAPTSALAQKLSEPPSAPPKVQQTLSAASAQSAFFVQMRTICVPLQLVPSFVGHEPGAVHAVVRPPVVQLGTVPPVMGIVPQQTSVLAQSEGAMQVVGTPPVSACIDESVPAASVPGATLESPFGLAVDVSVVEASVPLPVPPATGVSELHAEKPASAKTASEKAAGTTSQVNRMSSP